MAARPPAFRGVVGQFERGEAFVAFLGKHPGRAVSLEVRIPAREFDGSLSGGTPFLVVWDDCPGGLKPGEKPAVGRCTGSEISVERGASGRGGLVRAGSEYRLRGLFRVGRWGGPHQGLMAVTLKPVAGGRQRRR